MGHRAGAPPSTNNFANISSLMVKLPSATQVLLLATWSPRAVWGSPDLRWRTDSSKKQSTVLSATSCEYRVVEPSARALGVCFFQS